MAVLHDDAAVTLRKRELRGSRLRFLMLTSGSREQVAIALTGLVASLGIVDPSRDRWMPEGFLNPKEAKLSECGQLLPPRVRSQLTEWWLKVPMNANTPNWDLASTCTVDGHRGILLVEGKAHRGELKEDGKVRGNGQNDEQIERAIEEANQGLNGITPGWNLSRGSHYQLSNRFACAWKIASLGVPTILVYLGFLHATEMSDLGAPFGSPEDWGKAVRDHSLNGLAAGDAIVPASAWESRLQTSGAPLWALVRTLDQRWPVGRPRDKQPPAAL